MTKAYICVCEYNKTEKKTIFSAYPIIFTVCFQEVTWEYISNASWSADAIIDIGNNGLMETVIADYMGVLTVYAYQGSFLVWTQPMREGVTV